MTAVASAIAPSAIVAGSGTGGIAVSKSTCTNLTFQPSSVQLPARLRFVKRSCSDEMPSAGRPKLALRKAWVGT